nr:hypothetical protein [Sphingomonas alpina]
MAIRIDGHAIGIALIGGELREELFVDHVAGFVEHHPGNALRRRIGAIHGVGRRKGRAVGHHDAVADRHRRRARIEPIQHARRALLRIVHRARPEAPRRIDLAVVEAIARRLVDPSDHRSDRDMQRRLVDSESHETRIATADQSALRIQAKRGEPEAKRLNVIRAADHIVAVQRAAFDIDPPDQVARGIP